MIASERHSSFSEVARLAGVSVSTVSRVANSKVWAGVVLTDPSPVGEQTYRQRLLGYRPRGGRRPWRLTAQDVRRIKQRLLRGETLRSVAADYGVDFSYVGRIARGEAWAHISAREGVDASPLRRFRKLTAEIALEIRSRENESTAALAEEFGVHSSTVRKIRSRETWRYARARGAKLTAATAREMRLRLERGEAAEKLMAEYDISATTLWRVRTGRSWQ